MDDSIVRRAVFYALFYHRHKNLPRIRYKNGMLDFGVHIGVHKRGKVT